VLRQQRESNTSTTNLRPDRATGQGGFDYLGDQLVAGRQQVAVRVDR
jgi:hypothetical protein